MRSVFAGMIVVANGAAASIAVADGAAMVVTDGAAVACNNTLSCADLEPQGDLVESEPMSGNQVYTLLKQHLNASTVQHLRKNVDTCGLHHDPHHSMSFNTTTYRCQMFFHDDSITGQIAGTLLRAALPHCEEQAIMDTLGKKDHLPVRKYKRGTGAGLHADDFVGWTVLAHLSSGKTTFQLGDEQQEVHHEPGDVLVWWNTGHGPFHFGTTSPTVDKVTIPLALPASQKDQCEFNTTLRSFAHHGSR